MGRDSSPIIDDNERRARDVPVGVVFQANRELVTSGEHRARQRVQGEIVIDQVAERRTIGVSQSVRWPVVDETLELRCRAAQVDDETVLLPDAGRICGRIAVQLETAANVANDVLCDLNRDDEILDRVRRSG
jgi:hypothetical protein